MALVACGECGREISTAAKSCPGCGAPQVVQSSTPPPPPPQPEAAAEAEGSWFSGLLKWIIIGVACLAALSMCNSTPPTGAGLDRSAAQIAADDRARAALGSATDLSPRLKLNNFKCYMEYDYAFVTGEVTNISGEAIEHVTAVATWRTKGGEFVKSDTAIIEYDPLLPNQRSPFKVGTTDNPAMKNCSVEFKELMGGSISTTR